MSQQHRYFRHPLKLHSPQQSEEESSRKRKEKKEHKPRRYSLFALFLMAVGAVTLLVLIAKYIVIPILVAIPQWMEGGV